MQDTKCEENVLSAIEKLDYDLLEKLLMSNKTKEYWLLLELCNKEWATKLGFTLKMRWSPKSNADGSMTLRLYCSKN